MSEQADLPDRDELEELQEIMERLGKDEEHIRKVLRMAKVDPEFYHDRIDDFRRTDAIENPVPRPYPTPYPSYPGEFVLGQNPDGHPVGLTRRQLNEHMLVVGRSGAGKTTFFYNLMDTLHEKDVPFLVFDFKDDYRHVVDDFDLAVVNWRDFRFNPLQPPPGVPVSRWAEVFADTWTHAEGLLKASRNHLLPKLRSLYDLYSDELDAGRYPSLFELRDLVDAEEIPYASPRYRYKERIVSRLTGMLAFSGDIFDCSCGFPIEELLDRNVVVELAGVNQEVQTFAVEALLTWIFYYRDAQGHREGLRHAVLFDEAKQVFDVQREQNTDIVHPPITGLMGRVREFGEALVVADHEPSKLSDSLKANTNAKLWMSLGAGHDVEEMAETFGVEDEEVDVARVLDRGEAVFKTAERKPVPVDLPRYIVDKDASGQDVRERMQPVLDEFDIVDRVRPDLFKSRVGDQPGDGPDGASDEERETDIGELAEALLASVDEQPFLSMSERYDEVGAGSKQGNAAKNELVKLELVQEVEVDTGKPGRNPKLLELTEQGEQVLAERGHDVADTGRRGIVHRYWQRQVADHYEADGFDVEIEHAVDGGSIDVYAEQPRERVAIEVAMSPEHEVANVEKCLDAGVDRVEVVALEDDVRERIEAAVRDAFDGGPDRVSFVDVSEHA